MELLLSSLCGVWAALHFWHWCKVMYSENCHPVKLTAALMSGIYVRTLLFRHDWLSLWLITGGLVPWTNALALNHIIYGVLCPHPKYNTLWCGQPHSKSYCQSTHHDPWFARKSNTFQSIITFPRSSDHLH